jgi:cobalt transporter subunit CbtA
LNVAIEPIPMLKPIVAAAALAGLVAGLLLTTVQQIEVAPLIRAAEAREAAHAVAAGAGDQNTPAWAPREGPERLTATAIANVVLATAYAMLLGAAMSLRRQSGWRPGVLWGLAGYVVFFVAPALGLPPQLPGNDVAPLADRQIWWISAASCAAVGLWLSAFAGRPGWRVLWLALVLVPHVVGAPLSTGPGDEDSRAFIRATYVTNAALWLMLGVLVGGMGKRAVVTRPSP